MLDRGPDAARHAGTLIVASVPTTNRTRSVDRHVAGDPLGGQLHLERAGAPK